MDLLKGWQTPCSASTVLEVEGVQRCGSSGRHRLEELQPKRHSRCNQREPRLFTHTSTVSVNEKITIGTRSAGDLNGGSSAPFPNWLGPITTRFRCRQSHARSEWRRAGQTGSRPARGRFRSQHRRTPACHRRAPRRLGRRAASPSLGLGGVNGSVEGTHVGQPTRSNPQITKKQKERHNIAAGWLSVVHSQWSQSTRGIVASKRIQYERLAGFATPVLVAPVEKSSNLWTQQLVRLPCYQFGHTACRCAGVHK